MYILAREKSNLIMYSNKYKIIKNTYKIFHKT